MIMVLDRIDLPLIDNRFLVKYSLHKAPVRRLLENTYGDAVSHDVLVGAFWNNTFPSGSFYPKDGVTPKRP
jgi:hypothetical protein